MRHFYQFFEYIDARRLPLCIEYVPRGSHPERSFHHHEFSEIVLVMDGTALHLVGKARMMIKAGDVLVLHPGVSHAYDKTGDLELINIVYERKRLSLPVLDGYKLPLFRVFFPPEVPPASDSMAKPVTSIPKDEMGGIIHIIRRLEDELKNSRPGNFFLGLALYMELIIMLARHDVDTIVEHEFQFMIGEVIKFMNKNLKRNIVIEELVAVARMSRRNLFRNFRLTTGHSPIGYLQQLRLQKAAEMLLDTDLTISEIAMACGFCDSNYLCRIFREKMKTTPRRFRMKVKSEAVGANCKTTFLS